LDILQPLDEVTKELQGRPGENQRNPAPIADVLIAYEYLLHHLERVKEQYKTHPEQHFRWSVELGWAKTNKYYELLDKSPAYIAAVVLHPRRKWQWIDVEWKDKPQWREDAKAAVARLWARYVGLQSDIRICMEASCMEASCMEANRQTCCMEASTQTCCREQSRLTTQQGSI